MPHRQSFRFLCLTLSIGLCLACAEDAAPKPAPTADAAPAPATAPRLLRQLLIADSVEQALAMVAKPDAGFVVLSPTLSTFNAAELTKRLEAGQNRPIDERLLAASAAVIEAFLQQNEYPNAKAIVPTQSIAEGVVRIIVQLGDKSKAMPVTASTEWKIRNINMQGTRWFSESLLREKLRIGQGAIVRAAELERAIYWTNTSPFRRVHVNLQPVANTGEADLNIAIKEAFPLRLVTSADNYGSDLIGRNHYSAYVSYANLWGRDHQVALSYVTSSKPKFYKAYGFEYRVPLPWQHYLQVSGSYVQVKPLLYDGLIEQRGENVSTDIRYTIPLQYGNNSSEVFALLSFKQGNNNLTWDPTFQNVQVFSTTTDVFQLTLGGSVVRRDKRGAWAFGASVTASPGGINSRNTDRAFDASRYGGADSARVGAKARYAYASVSAQRFQSLTKGWDLMSRALVQVSEANLLPSEQLSIGGNSTVRGFNESIFAGDHGFVLSTELLAPSWKYAIPRISKARGPLDTRLLVFLDAANTAVRHKYPTDFKRKGLVGTGLGVRMSLGNNFGLAADYGWQVSDLPYQVENHTRGHIKATLAF